MTCWTTGAVTAALRVPMCHKEKGRDEKLTSGQPQGQLQSTSGFALKEAAAEDLEQMTHRQSCGHLQCQHHRHV